MTAETVIFIGLFLACFAPAILVVAVWEYFVEMKERDLFR